MGITEHACAKAYTTIYGGGSLYRYLDLQNADALEYKSYAPCKKHAAQLCGSDSLHANGTRHNVCGSESLHANSTRKARVWKRIAPCK